MLGKRLIQFKGFRDPNRDAQTDLQRSEKVLQAIMEALSGLDVERTGLGRRVEELRAWVGGLMGSEDGSDGHREGRVEVELVEAERQLMQGLKRLSDLAVIRGSYRDLQTTIASERERALQAARADG
ncbi:MAG: hypothetical protein ACRYGP_05375 [Janthinobacterium lividum]